MRSDSLRSIEVLTRSEDEALARLERLAALMDTALRIPGTNIRFGLDPILGLLPVVGDALSSLVSVYIILELADLGVPVSTRLRMLWNVILDFGIGSVPVAGDILDVAMKVNRKNLLIARRSLQRKAARKR